MVVVAQVVSDGGGDYNTKTKQKKAAAPEIMNYIW